ncbi:dTMP kinase, partial [candidate division WWE3 bacterium]|nr:dTMP kinase [candidate division WWE3 bacterium]
NNSARQKRALDIVIEGLASSGKSTQSDLLAEHIEKKLGLKVFRTREPGGTEIADSIRQVAQAQKFIHEDMTSLTEAYLYAASRAQSLPRVTKARLTHDVLLRDRDVVSSIANQAFGRELGFETVWQLNSHAIEANDGLPDYYLFIDTPVEITINRMNDAVGDKFEEMGQPYHQRVSEGYTFVSQHPIFKDKWIRVDGNGTVEEVHQKVLKALLPYLRTRVH